MNQTKKRLSIINLAISITDIETIQLQVLKLGLLKTDEKIQEILSMLQNENYAQAQALITAYIDTPTKEVLQRTFQKEKEKRRREENAVIDEFDLFTTQEDQQGEREIRTLDLDDMLRLESEEENTSGKRNEEERRTLDLDEMLSFEEEAKENKPRTVHEEIDFDNLLSVKNEDILPNNIDIDISHSENNDFWNQEESPISKNDSIPRDTFFDEVVGGVAQETEEVESPVIEYPFPEQQNDMQEESQEETKEETETQIVQETKQDTLSYKPIPYIDQKFKNMQVQYPVVEVSDEHFASVNKWLLKISNDGYTEEEIEAMIQSIDELRSENKSEAALLLLITAATESKYAQFRLARTLYRGDILQKNLPEAFTLINRLATYDDYPEAICDLAQFYEYGVGIEKDKSKAEALYKEAKDAGIKRAAEHFERLQKDNKGFLAFLTK